MTVIPIKTVESLETTVSLTKERGLRHLGPSSGDKLSDWWFDWIEEYFSCDQCGQVFHLFVEAYHGSGGALEPSSETVESLSTRFAASKAAIQTYKQSQFENRQVDSQQTGIRRFWQKFWHALEIGLATAGLIYLGVQFAKLLAYLFSQ